MNNIDKALLIKDLCARLPYGVKALFYIKDKVVNIAISCSDTITSIDVANNVINDEYFIEDVKPYLFPMASMTKEQCNEAFKESKNNPYPESNFIDYLNAHHFDYKGLIDKNLAIDATGLDIY